MFKGIWVLCILFPVKFFWLYSRSLGIRKKNISKIKGYISPNISNFTVEMGNVYRYLGLVYHFLYIKYFWGVVLMVPWIGVPKKG